MRVALFAASWMPLFALSVSTLPLAAAEEPTQRAIDEYVKSEMENQRIPGLSLAVVQSGKLVLAKGYGKASLELDAPARTSTLYGLGSISKQFTATAIMLLVEERKIGLDDRVTNYFGWLPKEWGEITVRHLLTHTSGIRQEQWKGGIVEFDRFEHDQEEVVRTAFGPMLARPGEKFAYSNVGYRLLGMLIEKASGQSYWDFLEQRIFRRIGMDVTRNSECLPPVSPWPRARFSAPCKNAADADFLRARHGQMGCRVGLGGFVEENKPRSDVDAGAAQRRDDI